MFAAVELREKETPHAVVGIIMRKANELGHKFVGLELLGLLSLGRIRFVRFQCKSRLIEPVLKALDRGVIMPKGGDYFLGFPGEEPKKVSVVTMALSGEPALKRWYRGPGVRLWERQFL